MNKITQLESSSMPGWNRALWVHSPLPHAVSVPTHAFLCVLKARLTPLFEAGFWKLSPELVSGFVLSSCPVYVGHQCPPSEPLTPCPGDSGHLPADHRVGPDCTSRAALLKRQRRRLLPLGVWHPAPGTGPGESKLGPGFLLLFSVHTAAAFIAVLWTWSPGVVSQPSLLRHQGEMKLVSLCSKQSHLPSTRPAPCKLTTRQWTGSFAYCLSENSVSRDWRADWFKSKRLTLGPRLQRPGMPWLWSSWMWGFKTHHQN